MLFVSVFLVGIMMMLRNLHLLKKRLNAKEKEAGQSMVIRLSDLMVILGFALAGLDFRFQWFVLPSWVLWAAAVVFLLSHLLFAEVLRENTCLSRTIEVQKNQKLISIGLYGIICHPMDSATLSGYIEYKKKVKYKVIPFLWQ